MLLEQSMKVFESVSDKRIRCQSMTQFGSMPSKGSEQLILFCMLQVQYMHQAKKKLYYALKKTVDRVPGEVVR